MSELVKRARIAVFEVIQQSDLPVGTYINSEKIVLAVLKAIREPSGEIISAGSDYMPGAGYADNAWRAMIDAILREKVDA